MNYNLAAFFLAAVALGASSTAQEVGLEKCLEIEADAARLTCYDEVFDYSRGSPAKLATSETTERAAKSGNSWVLIENKDSFTEADKSVAYLDSEDAGRAQSLTTLAIACNGEGDSIIMVSTSGNLGRGAVQVRYKFGIDEATFAEWHATSTGNGDAAIVPPEPQIFQNRITSSDSVLIEVRGRDGTPHTGQFNGLSNNTKDRDFALSGCVGNKK